MGRGYPGDKGSKRLFRQYVQRAISMEECSVFGELQGIQYGWNLQCEGAMEMGEGGEAGGVRS